MLILKSSHNIGAEHKKDIAHQSYTRKYHALKRLRSDVCAQMERAQMSCNPSMGTHTYSFTEESSAGYPRFVAFCVATVHSPFSFEWTARYNQLDKP